MKYEEYQQRVDKEQILDEIIELASDPLPKMSSSYYLLRLGEIRELEKKDSRQLEHRNLHGHVLEAQNANDHET